MSVYLTFTFISVSVGLRISELEEAVSSLTGEKEADLAREREICLLSSGKKE